MIGHELHKGAGDMTPHGIPSAYNVKSLANQTVITMVRQSTGGRSPADLPVNTEQRAYDYRPSHPLTPAYKRLIVTEQLPELAKNANKFTVTIAPVLAGGTTVTDQEIVKLEKISIITYD